MSSELVMQITGIIPAVIFPTASLLQLVALLRRRKSEGVSALSWFFFGFANICLYVYTQKYDEWAAIVTFLGTSALNFAICILALYYRRKSNNSVS
jgi:FtsH-binding integral membrane protein